VNIRFLFDFRVEFQNLQMSQKAQIKARLLKIQEKMHSVLDKKQSSVIKEGQARIQNARIQPKMVCLNRKMFQDIFASEVNETNEERERIKTARSHRTEAIAEDDDRNE
jgi:hypothetical protein